MLVKVAAEGVELLGPELLVVGDPGCRLFHGLGLQRALHDAAFLAAFDEPGVLEHAQMLHEAGKRHVVPGGKLAHLPVAPLGKLGEHMAPGTIRERGEERVELGVGILNHSV